MNIERNEILKSIESRFLDYPIVALTGPRQVRKTTLAKQFVANQKEDTHFFDLESPKDIARLANPELILSSLKGTVILDEIQRVPDLFPVLRVLADRDDKDTRFLILGSASPELINSSSESLAGRVSLITISGFSINELDDKEIKKNWLRGGFPKAYLARNLESCWQWHNDFISTFLERDIPQLGIRIPSQTLRRFWTMLAHFHGQVANMSEISRSLGTTEPTTRRYLDILTGTYMVRQLQPWHENLKKRQVKSPKIYIRDTGILHYLLGISDEISLQSNPKLGSSWEGYVTEQILLSSNEKNAYFWATHAGAEIDLLLLHKGQRIGIEIKYTEKPSTTKSMNIAFEDLSLDKLYVICPTSQTYPLKEDVFVSNLSTFIQHELN